MSTDPHDPDPDEDRELRAATLFDIRRIIGGLFLLYGITLTVLGFGASDEDLQRAEGVNVNLLVGVTMLVTPTRHDARDGRAVHRLGAVAPAGPGAGQAVG
jgi:hypothetical protein